MAISVLLVTITRFLFFRTKSSCFFINELIVYCIHHMMIDLM